MVPGKSCRCKRLCRESNQTGSRVECQTNRSADKEFPWSVPRLRGRVCRPEAPEGRYRTPGAASYLVRSSNRLSKPEKVASLCGLCRCGAPAATAEYQLL